MISERQFEELLKYEHRPLFSPELSLASQVLLDNGLIEPATRVVEKAGSPAFAQVGYYAMTEKGRKAFREYLLEMFPKESELYQAKITEMGRIGFDVGQE